MKRLAAFLRNWGSYIISILIIIAVAIFVSSSKKKDDAISSSVSRPSVEKLEPKKLKQAAVPRIPVARHVAYTGYNNDCRQVYSDGLSKLKIDGSKHGQDVKIKLYGITEAGDLRGVRCFSVKGGDQFLVELLPVGEYEFHYKNMVTGDCFKSERFKLEANKTKDGVEFSNVKITLHEVVGGNFSTTPIPAEEF